MGDLAGRKVFKVFNQDFVVDERYTVTKELGQGAYGIVWSVSAGTNVLRRMLTTSTAQQPTLRLVKAWPSKKSPMSSAKRSSQRELCVKSSSYNISAATEM